MSSHAVLLYYKQTLSHCFPLILVVGREPNSTEPIDDSIGEYDWAKAPTGFWATANEVVAEVAGLGPAAYKAQCRARKASPVVISNAMRQSVPDGSGRQRRERAAATKDLIAQHLANLFRHSELLSRVECVVFSGLEDDVFATPRQGIEDYFQSAKKLSLPHMRNTNRTKIRTRLDEIPGARAEIQRIFDHFKAATEPQAATTRESS